MERVPLVASTDTGVRTYEVVTKDGTFRIDVPANAKITFGPIIGVNGKPGYDGGGNSLRIWEGDKIQRALFLGVQSFRDLSLPMKVRAVRLFGTENWTKDDGTWTGKRSDLVEKGWVSSDDLSGEVIEEITPEVEAGPVRFAGMRPRANRSIKIETPEEDSEVPF